MAETTTLSFMSLDTSRVTDRPARVALVNGARTVVAYANTGSGAQILLPEASVLDADDNRVLVIDFIRGAVISFDLASGDRTLISDANSGAGPSFSYPLSIALDAASGPRSSTPTSKRSYR
jgi:hypothetical protein